MSPLDRMILLRFGVSLLSLLPRRIGLPLIDVAVRAHQRRLPYRELSTTLRPIASIPIKEDQ